ncbi:Sorbin and SH3 domain-containing protein 1 [Chytriomyces hyalinus]|nr:Sorbin and SH3 domain-containing protein 1 [Chytriomyces hyalinus]
MAALCLPLAASAMCPEFAAFQAYIPPGAPIRDIASFDSFVAQSFGAGFTDLVQRSSQGGYGCSGWNGTGMRYVHSIICAYYVQMGFSFSAQGSSSPCNAAAPQRIPVCSSTLDAFSAAWDAVFANPASCPSGMPASAQGYKSLLLASQQFTSTDAGCMVGVAEENGTCGYLTAAEAIAYCTAPINESQPCCTGVQGLPPKPASTSAEAAVTTSAPAAAAAPAIAKEKPTANAAGVDAINAPRVSTSTSPQLNQNVNPSNSPATGLSVGAISGISIGAIVVVAGALIAFRIHRKRSQTGSPLSDYKLNTMNVHKRSSDLELASNPSGMGYATPAPLTPSKTSAGPVGGQTREALSDYTPSQPDELAIKRRDKITIDYVYDDGWAVGFNNRTIKDGVFPVFVFEAPENDPFGKLQTNRTSSIYGVLPIQKPQDESILGQQHRAVFEFTPELDDEVAVRVGDTIILLKEFDDGWAFGKNARTGQSGLFPIDCIFGTPGNEPSTKNQRASSIYATATAGAPNNDILDDYASSSMNKRPDSEIQYQHSFQQKTARR